MKSIYKINMTFGFVLLLSACGAANMAVSNETQLVATTKLEAKKECSKYGDIDKGEPASRSAVLKFHHCMIEVADRTLMPHSSFPDIWLDARAKGLRAAKQYYNGQIDYDEYKAQGAEVNADSMRKMQDRLQQMQQRQMQASKIFKV